MGGDQGLSITGGAGSASVSTVSVGGGAGGWNPVLYTKRESTGSLGSGPASATGVKDFSFPFGDAASQFGYDEVARRLGIDEMVEGHHGGRGGLEQVTGTTTAVGAPAASGGVRRPPPGLATSAVTVTAPPGLGLGMGLGLGSIGLSSAGGGTVANGVPVGDLDSARGTGLGLAELGLAPSPAQKSTVGALGLTDADAEADAAWTESGWRATERSIAGLVGVLGEGIRFDNEDGVGNVNGGVARELSGKTEAGGASGVADFGFREEIQEQRAQDGHGGEPEPRQNRTGEAAEKVTDSGPASASVDQAGAEVESNGGDNRYEGGKENGRNLVETVVMDKRDSGGMLVHETPLSETAVDHTVKRISPSPTTSGPAVGLTLGQASPATTTKGNPAQAAPPSGSSPKKPMSWATIAKAPVAAKVGAAGSVVAAAVVTGAGSGASTSPNIVGGASPTGSVVVSATGQARPVAPTVVASSPPPSTSSSGLSGWATLPSRTPMTLKPAPSPSAASLSTPGVSLVPTGSAVDSRDAKKKVQELFKERGVNPGRQEFNYARVGS
ncbi:hypothetical protein HDU93_003659, partial [Gonapodya sp. JEL0774]